MEYHRSALHVHDVGRHDDRDDDWISSAGDISFRRSARPAESARDTADRTDLWAGLHNGMGWLQRVRVFRSMGAAPGCDAVTGNGCVKCKSWRSYSLCSRPIPIDAFKASLSHALPGPARVSNDILARWRTWGVSDGNAPWRLLSGLLLGVDVGLVRRWNNEPGLGGNIDAVCTLGKDGTCRHRRGAFGWCVDDPGRSCAFCQSVMNRLFL